MDFGRGQASTLTALHAVTAGVAAPARAAMPCTRVNTNSHTRPSEKMLRKIAKLSRKLRCSCAKERKESCAYMKQKSAIPQGIFGGKHSRLAVAGQCGLRYPIKPKILVVRQDALPHTQYPAWSRARSARARRQKKLTQALVRGSTGSLRTAHGVFHGPTRNARRVGSVDFGEP